MFGVSSTARLSAGAYIVFGVSATILDDAAASSDDDGIVDARFEALLLYTGLWNAFALPQLVAAGCCCCGDGMSLVAALFCWPWKYCRPKNNPTTNRSAAITINTIELADKPAVPRASAGTVSPSRLLLLPMLASLLPSTALLLFAFGMLVIASTVGVKEEGLVVDGVSVCVSVDCNGEEVTDARPAVVVGMVVNAPGKVVLSECVIEVAVVAVVVVVVVVVTELVSLVVVVVVELVVVTSRVVVVVVEVCRIGVPRRLLNASRTTWHDASSSSQKSANAQPQRSLSVNVQ